MKTTVLAGVALGASLASAEPSPLHTYTIRYTGAKNPPAISIDGELTNVDKAVLTFQIGDHITIRTAKVPTVPGRTRRVTGWIQYFKEKIEGGFLEDDTINYNRDPITNVESVNVNAYVDYGPMLSILPKGKPGVPWVLFGIGTTNKNITLDQLQGAGYAFTASRSGKIVLLAAGSFVVRTETFWLSPPIGQADQDWCTHAASHWCDGKRYRDDDVDVPCTKHDVTCSVETGTVDVTVFITLERPK